MRNYITILALLFLLLPAISFADVLVTDCTTINTMDNYYLDNNLSLSGVGNCFYIEALNSTFDCQGHTITVTEGNGAVIYSSAMVNNFTLKNCNIVTNSLGIEISQMTNSSIQNVNISNQGINSIYLAYVNNFEIDTIEIDTSDVGIQTYISNISIVNANINSVNNAITSTESNITLYDSDLNTTNSPLYIYASYLDINNVNVNYIQGIPIEFLLYDVNYCDNTITNFIANGKDVLYFDDTVDMDNWDLSELILCNATGSNVTNTHVTNGSIYVYFTDNARFINVSVENNTEYTSQTGKGIYLYESSNNSFINSTLINNEYGLFITGNSDYNKIINGTFISNNKGFYIEDSDHNLIDGNTINFSEYNFGEETSCPFAYTWNGTEYVFISDMSTEGKLGNPYSSILKPNDYLKVSSEQLVPKDNVYSVMITEEYDEIVYMDKLHLITIDHSPEYDVYNGLTRADEHTIFTVNKNQAKPVSCINALGNDCLTAIDSIDGIFTMYPVDNVQNTITVDLGNLSSAENVNVIISYSWANGYLTSNIFKEIQVKNMEGDWVTILADDDLTTRAALQKTYVLNMTGKFLSDDYSIRFVLPIQSIDYIGVDTSEQQEYVLNDYSPITADLHYRGYSNYVVNITKNFFYNSLITQNDFSNPKGNFTKYGDVTELLSVIDDQYVIIHHGDEIALEFPYNSIEEGMERSFFINGYSYYKHASGIYGDTVEPLPFKEMSTYPYSEDENYPYDEMNEYLIEYNTREYVIDNYGMSLPFSINTTVINNVIIGNDGGYGLYLNFEDGSNLSYNTISNVLHGIYSANSENLNIQHNNISNTFYYSIYLTDVDTSNISNNRLNLSESLDAVGIHVDSSSSNLYYNNYMFTEGISPKSIDDINVENGARYTGIYLAYDENSVISSNTILMFNRGVHLVYGTNLTVYANNMSDLYYEGIYSELVTGSNFSENYISSLTGGIYIYNEENGNNSITDNTLIVSDYIINEVSVLYRGNIGMYITSFENNITGNNITAPYWMVIDGSNNFNNSVYGNIYYFVNGTPSWEVYHLTDSNNDGWADGGINYPFNASLSGGEWEGNGTDWHPYLGSVKKSSGSSSSSREELYWSYDFDCETGLITIETEEDIELRLINKNDYSTYKGTTNSNGKLQFTLTSDGPYDIYSSSTGDYYALSDDFRVTFCKPVEEIPSDEDGEDEIIVIVNETNETEEEIIIPEIEENHTELENLIQLAESELNRALSENKNVFDAQQKLNEAKEQFNLGNYELAEQLTNAALEIIYNAEAQIPEKNETGIEGNQTEIPTEQTSEGFNWSLCIIGLSLVVLLYFSYKFLNKSKN